MTDNPNNIPVIDPTTKARDWLAANPEHEAAVHVRAALASADRYELLAREMEGTTGSRVVIASPTGRSVVFTSPSRMTEERIAQFVGRYLILIETVRVGLEREKAEAALLACAEAEREIARFRDGGK
jgi:hypothetical protein